MRSPIPVLLCFLLLQGVSATNAHAQPVVAADQELQQHSWASLVYRKTNGRAGPSRAFPKIWVYHRKYLPIKVLRRASQWSKVEDMDGVVLWMHNSVLANQRTALVVSATPAYLYGLGNNRDKVTARVTKGVIMRIDICDQTHCKVQIKGQQGWMERSALWGSIVD